MDRRVCLSGHAPALQYWGAEWPPVLPSICCRSAGVSEIEGSVSVCVPSWVPQSAAVAKAAAALQAGAADKVAPNTTCAPWQTLYFVTVTVESAQEKALRTKLPGTQVGTTLPRAGEGGPEHYCITPPPTTTTTTTQS
jgi:hypothetical protein